MLITTAQKRSKLSRKLSVLMNNEPLDNVNSERLLGVKIDENLNWNDHISDVIRKIGFALIRLKRINQFLPIHSRVIFF
jgi:hypothetical protein